MRETESASRMPWSASIVLKIAVYLSAQLSLKRPIQCYWDKVMKAVLDAASTRGSVLQLSVLHKHIRPHHNRKWLQELALEFQPTNVVHRRMFKRLASMRQVFYH